MIPKKLHYCWFGIKPKPKLFQECFDSWQKFCPDFEIIEWNDQNTKQIQSKFFKSALRKKKYAFAADFIRTKVLFEQGGIYLDTDMILIKPIDSLLKYDFFSGEEVAGRVAYGFYGANIQNHIINQMLAFYQSNYFNEFSPPVITHTFSSLVKKENLQPNEIILSSEYFYSMPYEKRNENYFDFITDKSIAVHLWDHSWEVNKTEETVYNLLIKIKIVVIDFICFHYPYSYFKRYMKEFSRKMYYKILS